MTLIPKIREEAMKDERKWQGYAYLLNQYAAGQNVDDPLPCAYRDVCAALRCLREAAANLGRVK